MAPPPTGHFKINTLGVLSRSLSEPGVHRRPSLPCRGRLDARSQASRDRIEVVAIHPRRRLSQTITFAPPNAAISVDPFHLVQQANLMVASVRKHDLEVRHRHRRHKGAVRNSSAIVGCCYPD